MVGETKGYYDNITSTLDADLLRRYEAQIKDAEAARMENPKAMDIMANNGFKRNTSISPRSSVEESPLLNWLQMALRLEERQYVVSSHTFSCDDLF